MQRNVFKPVGLICILLILTGIAMAYSDHDWSWTTPIDGGNAVDTPTQGDLLSLESRLVQDKILVNGDGLVTVVLEIGASNTPTPERKSSANVDMVMVIDRSGSMQGEKLQHAQSAALDLIAALNAEDRWGLLTYSDNVRKVTALTPTTTENQALLVQGVENIHAAGGTNLGAGLKAGIAMLKRASASENIKKLVLISDGLANKGVIHPTALTQMAAVSAEHGVVVTTVGVGLQFNEHLLTALADHGAGNYYYLENPDAFKDVFISELRRTHATLASNVQIDIQLAAGTSLVNASGYPIRKFSDRVAIYPGNLLAGQTRKLFLTFKVPHASPGSIALGPISARYQYDGRVFHTAATQPLLIACIDNPEEVLTSIDKFQWEQKVLKEDYNRLKQEVAAEIKHGRENEALRRIDAYRQRQRTLNAVVGSSAVVDNLEQDVPALEQQVSNAFKGAPAEVLRKQKAQAKSLQYEGYRQRRDLP